MFNLHFLYNFFWNDLQKKYERAKCTMTFSKQSLSLRTCCCHSRHFFSFVYSDFHCLSSFVIKYWFWLLSFLLFVDLWTWHSFIMDNDMTHTQKVKVCFFIESNSKSHDENILIRFYFKVFWHSIRNNNHNNETDVVGGLCEKKNRRQTRQLD